MQRTQDTKMQNPSSNQSNSNPPSQALSQEDQRLLNQASQLVELLESQVYQELVLPKLMQLASEGYPKPQDFPNYEAMLPTYTFALGGTDKIKQLTDWLESQRDVANSIKTKQENRDKFAI